MSFRDGVSDDSNGQKQEKTPREEMLPEVQSGNGEEGADFSHPYPVGRSRQALPEPVRERRLARREARASLEGEVRPRLSTTRHTGAYFAMLASLLMALVIAIGVLSFSSVPIAQTEEEEAASLSSEKVVYVNGYGEGEGALSTPELYARCRASVVSILVGNGQTSGIGSGFVLDAEGYIATAHHVIAGMREIEVVLADGARYPAEVVGGDALTDLALLRIEAEGLSPVTLGSSADLLPGERVVAIGTPASLDYAGSISSGEVSYAPRTVKFFGEGGTLEKKMKLIQTDAPVNPGNSGCPLFDGRGKVVGMVTMKLGASFTGLGFAVPIDGAREVLDAMRRGEVLDDALLAAVSVRAACLGIVGEAYALNGTYGVCVRELASESDAARVLAVGDLIMAIGESPVTSAADVEEALFDHEPGERVTVLVRRNGQDLQFEVVLGARLPQ